MKESRWLTSSTIHIGRGLGRAWDDKAQEQIDNPHKPNHFEKFNDLEPCDRDIEFRSKQPFYQNNNRDHFA